MKDWLKENWVSVFVIGACLTMISIFLFQKKSDNGDLNQYKIDEKQAIIDVLTHENDSLLKIVTLPIPDNTITDSLLQISIDVNNKTLNELRKKRNAVIDTLDSSELQRIFSGYH